MVSEKDDSLAEFHSKFKSNITSTKNTSNENLQCSSDCDVLLEDSIESASQLHLPQSTAKPKETSTVTPSPNLELPVTKLCTRPEKLIDQNRKSTVNTTNQGLSSSNCKVLPEDSIESASQLHSPLSVAKSNESSTITPSSNAKLPMRKLLQTATKHTTLEKSFHKNHPFNYGTMVKALPDARSKIG